jgi:hypothetical protein
MCAAASYDDARQRNSTRERVATPQATKSRREVSLVLSDARRRQCLGCWPVLVAEEAQRRIFVRCGIVQLSAQSPHRFRTRLSSSSYTILLSILDL